MAKLRLPGRSPKPLPPPDPAEIDEDELLEEEDGQGARMGIFEHLDELRRRFTKAAFALVIGTLIGVFVSGLALEYLVKPYCEAVDSNLIDTAESDQIVFQSDCRLTNLGPTGGVVVYFRVSLMIGGMIAIPAITYQLLMFIFPGLTRKEKRVVLLSLPAITVLFLIGSAFAWFVLMRPALGFLASFQPTLFKPEWTGDLYIEFITSLIFWMGVAFETPLVFFVLGLLGIVGVAPLIRNWRIAVVGAAIAAALITPTIDPVNMFLVMGPLMVLYILSIILVFVARRIARIDDPSPVWRMPGVNPQSNSAGAMRIYGVPMDLGQSRRGVDMGPSAIRYAGLKSRLEKLDWQVHDGGNINVPVNEETEPDERVGTYPAHHITEIARVAREIHAAMLASIAADETVIFLGGDHSISLGSVSGALHRADRVGVIWVDAHGDFNTPQTSPSGNIHGMVVRSLMGQGPDMLAIGDRQLRPEGIVMIGVRDLDPQERIDLRESGIKVMTMRSIDEGGMANVVHATLNALGNVSAIHISFDMDSLDPLFAPGVGTPVPGGLNYREAHLLLEMLADDGRVRSMDIVEVNPILDRSNATAKIAADLAASLFGQRII